MSEHLKNFAVGLVATALIIAGGVLIGWLIVNFRIQMGAALAIVALVHSDLWTWLLAEAEVEGER